MRLLLLGLACLSYPALGDDDTDGVNRTSRLTFSSHQKSRRALSEFLLAMPGAGPGTRQYASPSFERGTSWDTRPDSYRKSQLQRERFGGSDDYARDQWNGGDYYTDHQGEYDQSRRVGVAQGDYYAQSRGSRGGGVSHFDQSRGARGGERNYNDRAMRPDGRSSYDQSRGVRNSDASYYDQSHNSRERRHPGQPQGQRPGNSDRNYYDEFRGNGPRSGDRPYDQSRSVGGRGGDRTYDQSRGRGPRGGDRDYYDQSMGSRGADRNSFYQSQPQPGSAQGGERHFNAQSRGPRGVDRNYFDQSQPQLGSSRGVDRNYNAQSRAPRGGDRNFFDQSQPQLGSARGGGGGGINYNAQSRGPRGGDRDYYDQSSGSGSSMGRSDRNMGHLSGRGDYPDQNQYNRHPNGMHQNGRPWGSRGDNLGAENYEGGRGNAGHRSHWASDSR